MKEFAISIKKDIVRGLRKDDRNPRNSGFLTQCQNIRPAIYPGGVPDLSIYTHPADPFAAGYIENVLLWSESFPFPQIFKGRERTFLLGQDKIAYVTEASNWTAVEQATYDAYKTTASKSITGGDSWHFVDFGKSYAFLNGSCMVFKRYKEGMFGGTDNILVVDDITIQTACEFRGRMVMGGFSTTDFFNDEWENFMRQAYDQGIGLNFVGGLGTNFVWWSPIGSHPFWLVYPTETLLGNIEDHTNTVYTYDKNMLWDLLQRNEMGFMPMRWQGNVLCVKGLDKGFMVYGDNGVSYMPMSDVDGISTFGVQEILPYGIAGRSAVGSNTIGSEHIFIDEAGWLWRISSKGKEKLGYREFFENMLGSDIVISYDPIEDDYYISDGTECYVLTEAGLFESTYLTTSVAVSLGGSVSMYERPGNSDDDYILLTTDTINMGIGMVKTLTRVTVLTTDTTGIQIAVSWRYKTTDSWNDTGWTSINDEGEAYLPVGGIEFRVKVRCTNKANADIDDIVVHYQTSDKRELRGMYALNRVGE